MLAHVANGVCIVCSVLLSQYIVQCVVCNAKYILYIFSDVLSPSFYSHAALYGNVFICH